MALGLLLPLRIVQTLLALVVLGASGYGEWSTRASLSLR